MIFLFNIPRTEQGGRLNIKLLLLKQTREGKYHVSDQYFRRTYILVFRLPCEYIYSANQRISIMQVW